MNNSPAIVKIDKANNDNGMGWKHYRTIETTDYKMLSVIENSNCLEEKNSFYCYNFTSSRGISLGKIYTIDNNLFD